MFNIEQFLIKEKIEYRGEGKNVGRGEVNICCPFCSEGRYHLGINIIKNMFHCWICGIKGDITKLVSKLKNISYNEAKEIINPQNDLKKVLEERSNKLVKIEKKPIKNKELKLPPHTYPFRTDKMNIWAQTAIKFLRDKYDLTNKEIIEADLHYCVHGKYKNCIIVPIYKDEKLINFLGRCWDKRRNLRYINCPNEGSILNIHKTLYNIDNIKINQDLLIVVEGVFDCIKVKSVYNNVVATFGTEVSQEQLNLIVGLKPKKLLILADNDINNLTTMKKAKEISNYLAPFMKTEVVEVPYAGFDPADLTKQDIANLIKL